MYLKKFMAVTGGGGGGGMSVLRNKQCVLVSRFDLISRESRIKIRPGKGGGTMHPMRHRG